VELRWVEAEWSSRAVEVRSSAGTGVAGMWSVFLLASLRNACRCVACGGSWVLLVALHTHVMVTRTHTASTALEVMSLSVKGLRPRCTPCAAGGRQAVPPQGCLQPLRRAPLCNPAAAARPAAVCCRKRKDSLQTGLAHWRDSGLLQATSRLDTASPTACGAAQRSLRVSRAWRLPAACVGGR
jgi:hypothetical protein